jgi:isopentenyl diphosphate isomerase/L-lactate dehydrogenase-like FMN-dependent dehydrogenase
VTERGEPLNVHDYERLAREALDPGAYVYFSGGAGDERTMRDNVEAYSRLRLRPRVLVDVGDATPATTVLDAALSMPLLVAPTALQRLAHPDGEPATARAAAAAGTVYCMSTLATATPAEVAEAAPGGARWFQLYCFRDRGVSRSLIDQAVDAGFGAIVLTVDMPFLGRRESDLRSGFAVPAEVTVPSFAAVRGRQEAATLAEIIELLDPTLTWDDVEEIASMSELPLLLKGILTAEDARLAADHGAAAAIVSNHGGRQLDGVPASLDALPEVVEAVGDRIPVLVDGGIRRGADVVKALALGASAALVGRPVVWGLAARGEDGARHVLELLREEVRLALALLGCPSPEAVTGAHVSRPLA